MERVKRPWKYVDGPEAAEAFAKFTGPKAEEMQRRTAQLEALRSKVSLKGNLFKPVAVAEYPGYPAYIPIDLFAYPERRLEFGVHVIKPGYGFPVHAHDYGDEVYLVVKGRGRVLIESEEFEAEPFDVFYMPSGKWHTGYNPKGNEEDFWLYIVGAPQMSLNMRAAGWELSESMWAHLGYRR